MMIPFPRHDEAARVAIFDREIAEAFRRGILDLAIIRRNTGRNLAFQAEDVQRYLKERHKPTHYRTSGWDAKYHQWRLEHNCEVLTYEDAMRADYDDFTIAARDRATARQRAQESIHVLRWGAWFLRRLDDPAVAAEIKAGPGVEFLHWGKPAHNFHGEQIGHTMPAILDNKGRVVAQVTREPRQYGGGNTPTIKAWIFARPGATTESPLAWCMFRTRKAAAAWIVNELHRRCYALWGTEIDLSEDGAP